MSATLSVHVEGGADDFLAAITPTFVQHISETHGPFCVATLVKVDGTQVQVFSDFGVTLAQVDETREHSVKVQP